MVVGIRPFDFFRRLLRFIPLNTLLQLDPVAAETVQRATNRQVHLALAQLLHHLQILQVPAAASVRHGQTAPLGQSLHQLLVDALLQTLVVCCVNEEL